MLNEKKESDYDFRCKLNGNIQCVYCRKNVLEPNDESEEKGKQVP